MAIGYQENRFGWLPHYAEHRRSFGEDGYVALKSFCRRARSFAEDPPKAFWAERPNSPLVIDWYKEYPNRPFTRQPFAETIVQAAWPYKLNDTHLEDDPIREFAIDDDLMRILRTLKTERTLTRTWNMVAPKGGYGDAPRARTGIASRNRPRATWLLCAGYHYSRKQELIRTQRCSGE